jgi:aspartyl-tRNA synthetase
MRSTSSLPAVFVVMAYVTSALAVRLRNSAPRFLSNSLGRVVTRPAAISTRLFAAAPEVSPVSTSVDYYSVDSNDSKLAFGDYNTIASNGQTGRTFTPTSMLGKEGGPKEGDVVWIRGRVSSVRAKGNACFMVVRSDSFYTVQACHFKDKANPEDSKALIKYVGGIALESIVDIMGVVVPADVKSCSQSNVEIQIKKIYTVSRAPAVLPFLLEDAARPQAEIDASQNTERPFAGVDVDMRLKNRWLDLRVPANNAIMRVRSGVSFLFREALMNEGFVEINTPKLIAGESEGGSDVFRTDYFGQVRT